jgi:hypothetical protein
MGSLNRPLKPEGQARKPLAKRLSRYPVNRRKRSLRDIAAELEAQGHVATTGRRYEATATARMIAA